MRGVKKWGIKIKDQWVMTSDSVTDAVYYVKKEAEQDADDFNSMRNRGDNPYTVEEYKNDTQIL